eukprot:XP_010644779.1 PREDICTED: uncharacterized protein LOC104877701 [Vitis vinifera]
MANTWVFQVTQPCPTSIRIELSFLPLNAEIHLIIHAYHIIKSIGSLISSHHCHFLPPKHIFSHPRTGAWRQNCNGMSGVGKKKEQFNPIADAEGRDLLFDMVHNSQVVSAITF